MYLCKVCGFNISKIQSYYDEQLYGFCEMCEKWVDVIEVSDHELDYDQETQTFSLVDKINNTIIVITKDQLEKLIEFYYKIKEV